MDAYARGLGLYQNRQWHRLLAPARFDVRIDSRRTSGSWAGSSTTASCEPTERFAVALFLCPAAELEGFISLSDQLYFKSGVEKTGITPQLLPPGHPLAQQFPPLPEASATPNLPLRSRLFQIFAEYFSQTLNPRRVEPAAAQDAKQRLLQLIENLTEAELPDWSIDRLAQTLHCSPRHASRLFTELFGVPFRTKQTELRLNKACDLLSASNGKIVNIALESGYQSLGLFNIMFKKRFGTTPGKWRQRQLQNSAPRIRACRPPACGRAGHCGWQYHAHANCDFDSERVRFASRVRAQRGGLILLRHRKSLA